MKLAIIGRTSYVGCSVKNYMEKHHSDCETQLVSSRDGGWKNADFSDCDAVFNVSGLCHADARQGTPEQYMSVNAELPFEMAKKARTDGAPLFIHMSSSIIFGRMSRMGEPKQIGRDAVPAPDGVYGASKLEAERRLASLEGEGFSVALIRAPLIYGENARDNFPRLVNFAKKSPLFPKVENAQSMIYIDNFCELIYLIVRSKQGGVYMPQDEEYICTSRIVGDIAAACGRKIWLTGAFTPLLKILSKRFYLINKVFGNITYDKQASDSFGGAYRVTDYKTAVDRIAKKE